MASLTRLLFCAPLVAARIFAVHSKTAGPATGRCDADSSGSEACGVPQVSQVPRGDPGVLLIQKGSTGLRKTIQPTGDHDDLCATSCTAKLSQEIASLRELVVDTRGSLESKVGSCCARSSCGSGGDPVVPGSESSMTTNSSRQTSLCAVFGDPHFTTFDGAHTILLREMTMWIVKSESIWIQAFSKETTGNFMGFAVGGPFMRGHSLILYNTSQNGNLGELRALWDGHQILGDLDSQGNAEFHAPFLLWAAHRPDWSHSLHDDEILEIDPAIEYDVGTWPSRFQGSPQGGVYYFRLPEGVEITTTGVDFMSAVIRMAPQTGGQSGFCGNFNGDPDDEFEPPIEGSVPPNLIPAWNTPIGEGLEPVLDEDNLFKRHAATSPLVLVSSEAHLNGRTNPTRMQQLCPARRMREAEKACAGIPSSFMWSACLSDFCLTGKAEVAQAVAQAELLEERSTARGVPVFVGHGPCVDTEGQQFRTVQSRFVRHFADCMAMLRDYAPVKGVLGAQLRIGGSCELTLDEGADETLVLNLSPPGGWAPAPARRAQQNARGTSFVADAKGDLAMSCWRMN